MTSLDHAAGVERAPELIAWAVQWLRLEADDRENGMRFENKDARATITKLHAAADAIADLSRAPALAEECERLRSALAVANRYIVIAEKVISLDCDDHSSDGKQFLKAVVGVRSKIDAALSSAPAAKDKNT